MDVKEIMLVEDSTTTSRIVDYTLHRFFEGRVNTTSFGTVQDAAAALRERPFDLIISDLNLPAQLGTALSELANEVAPYTPTMMISSYFNPKLTEEIEQVADAMLEKPLNIAEFTTAVEALLFQRPSKEAEAQKVEEPASPPEKGSLAHLLNQLCHETGGIYAALLHLDGYPLLDDGEPVPIQSLLNRLIIKSVSTIVTAAAKEKRKQPVTLMQYFEHDNYAVFTCAVNVDLIVVLIFEGERNKSRVGYVWLALQKAVHNVYRLDKEVRQLIRAASQA